MANEQQYCLKWNNHHSTILGVFDTLLEEESLVDVILSAEGQCLKAHRVILSACSPYFRNLFRSSFLTDKAPVIVLKDVDFENLKSLIDYMYKGEANVPQNMLQSFIRTAESLQIRGLAENANKSYDAAMAESEPRSPPRNLGLPGIHPSLFSSTPLPFKADHHGMGRKGFGNGNSHAKGSGGGILAAHLAKQMSEASGLTSPFDLGHELMQRKRRRDKEKDHPTKENSRKSKPSPNKSSLVPAPLTQIFNNNFNDEEGALKIDEDSQPGKENVGSSPGGGAGSQNRSQGGSGANDDDIVDFEASSNGGESDMEEEPSMPGPSDLQNTVRSGLIINPWTGEDMSTVINDNEEGSGHGGEGPMYPPLEHSLFDAASVAAAAASASANSAQKDHGSPANTADSGSSGPRDPQTNKFACNTCGRSYLHQATLVRHQRYECGKAACYPCSLCGRKFKRRDVLKGHVEKCVSKSAAAAAQVAASASASATPPFSSPLSS